MQDAEDQEIKDISPEKMQETKLNGESLDIVSQNVSKLKELFPEIVTEDKIDFDKLKEVLGKYSEDDKERYNFSWKGKSAALRLAQNPSMGTLRPCKEESKNWDRTENLYIEGDNLEVLKLLQKSYYGKIKMIYIDPPYNTGNDFVYPDNYNDNLQNYLEVTGQVDNKGTKISTNTDTSGRYHTNWLNMMYPRLRLARNLLTEDGVIFISIDDNEVNNLKKVCDELFGEENFICNFIWRKKTGASDSKDISTITEYVLTYVKNRMESFNSFTKNKESYDPNRYKLKDEYFNRRGPYYADNLDRGGIRYSDSLNYPITCPDGIITYPNGRTEFENDGWIWTWGKEKLKWGIENGFIVFKKSNKKKSGWGVYYKNYVNVNNKDELIERSAPHRNLIQDIINTEGTAEIQKLFNKKVFQYTKPSNFIKLLCSFVNNENGIVLDFFSGSGTTAHATMQLNIEDNSNRKFIMIQLQEPTTEKDEAYKAGYKNICEIGKERIRRAGDKIISEMNQNGQTSLDSRSKTDLDIGFKVFKLDSSNLFKWDPEYDNLEQTLLDSVENLVPGRNEFDLVYEIMLKYGIDLTLPIEEYPIKDKKFYSIGFGALIICLDDNLTSNLATEIVKLKDELSPEVMRVVFKDNGFASDSDKTNIKETLKTNGIEEFVTI